MSAFLIAESEVDLLFVESERRHLCRLPAGAVLPAAVLRHLSAEPREALHPILPDADPERFAAGVARWLDALARVASGCIAIPETASAILRDGDEIVLPQGGTVCCRGQMLWTAWEDLADAPAGLSWGGVPLYPDLPPMPVPLCPALGLHADGAVRVRAVDEREAVSGPPGEAAVEVVSLAMLRAVATLLGAQAEARATRRERRWLQMADGFQRSLGDFGPLLQGRFKRRLPEVEAQPALIRVACRVLEAGDMKPFTDFASDPGEAVPDALARFAADSAVRLRPVRLEGKPNSTAVPLLVLVRADPGGEPQPFALFHDWRGFYLEGAEVAARRLRVDAALWRRVEVAAYAFHPTLPAGKLGYRDVLLFGLKHARRSVAEIGAWGVLSAVLALGPPVAFGMVVTTIVPTRDAALLSVLVGGLALTLVLTTITRYAAEIAGLRLDGRLGLLVHGAMVDRLLRLPAAAWRSQPSLILATQLETVEKFRRGMTQQILAGGLAGTQLIVTAILLVAYDARAGLLALGLCGLLLAVAWIVGRRQFEAIYEGERIDVVVLAFVYDLIRLLPVLRAGGGERLAFTQWAQNFLAFQSRLFRSARIGNIAGIFEAGWEVAIYIAAFAALALAMSASAADSLVGAAVAVTFVAALERLVQSARGMAHAISAGAKLLPQAKLARAFIEHRLEVPGGRSPVGALSGDIEFAGVGFGYGPSEVLKDISFRVAPGSFVGIVGPSGSGKSTLLRLLLGLEEPGRGGIALDGRPLSTLDPRLVRRQIGSVLQHSRLFPGSIFENIRGATTIDLDAAWRLAERAGIAAELRALPMGLHTLVGEDGAGFSGGQVQRLLLARALAGDPRLLVLDEATSALDDAAQDRFGETLRQLAVTRLVVAHRFRPLVTCDEILVLDRGAIVQRGRFDELAGQEGLFRALLERQEISS